MFWWFFTYLILPFLMTLCSMYMISYWDGILIDGLNMFDGIETSWGLKIFWGLFFLYHLKVGIEWWTFKTERESLAALFD